ncbi:alkaline phosphatase family protein [Bacillus sp. V5-8f]|uniref:alkaline phosphatase family protein n=1 Tax=Bacillus sp. V5-8f TaxID=2053044 RepID=UPI000C764E76|nr:alkaline phosphatase family protein [Bacillus sp. V5-8f]PLT35699.1 phosphodiesterase [Bacillus sp. V5-8f]
MLVIDTLMDSPLQEAVKTGKAKALKFLMEHGQYYHKFVAPFPTMSVNVDTTLLTGTYCNQHGIPGLVWFSKEEKRLINYGTHYRELFKLGMGQAIEDFLFNLNEKHISHKVVTIHEELENRGRDSASINALVYRGNTAHPLNLPKILTTFTNIDKNRSAKASKLFSFGRFSKLHPSNRYQYFWKKLGVNDASSVLQLSHLINNNALPCFSIVYLPELDQRIHKNGRMDLKGIEKADKQLQKIFNLYDTWEKALEENIWIVLGDNGQAWVGPERGEAIIDLRNLLGRYRIMQIAKGIQPTDELVLAVNDRMAYIYTMDRENLPLQEIAKILQKDDRIDVIAWKTGRNIEVRSGGLRGEFMFGPEGEYHDQYGQSWFLQGDQNLLNLSVSGKEIKYGEYPDALARLYSCLLSHKGDFLVVSARPGHEIIGEGSPVHIGGAGHGGLHEQDSVVPIIITGTDSSPPYLRMVDLKKWILSLID